MPPTADNPEDIAMVREFFALLSRSERLGMYDFFKNRLGFDENSGQILNARTGGNDGLKLDPERGAASSRVSSNRGVK
jgi:hypothetical protein